MKLLAATLLLLTPLTPTLGPGAVLDLHRQLFTALDTGDAAKALTYLDTTSTDGYAEGQDGGLASPSLQLLDATNHPVSAYGPDACRALLTTLARPANDPTPWRTKIVSSRSDCPSGDLSYAVLEFERMRGDSGPVTRYRSTALTRWTRDGGMKLFHWHVSLAPVPETKKD